MYNVEQTTPILQKNKRIGVLYYPCTLQTIDYPCIVGFGVWFRGIQKQTDHIWIYLLRYSVGH